MASPSATSVTRRRQRSTRLTVAVALLLVSAALVAGAVLSGSWLLVSSAAVLGVVLGAAATKITHSELAQSRRDAARDRAEQAQAYRRLNDERSAEHASFVSTMQARIEEREEALAALQDELGTAQVRSAEVLQKMNAEARRADLAEGELERVRERAETAEQGAAETVVRIAELEHEVLVLRAELESVTVAWRASESARRRA